MRRCPFGKAVIQLLKSLASGLGFVLPHVGLVENGMSQTYLLAFVLETQIQHYTVDHLARGSMKNGANSVTQCELQDT